ncbi:MAG: hypothetical protein EZS28_011425 [Streblomastix strix]|uniref:DDE-1 domain-containing protein n=1 Tax=Streblomastix strix TaxID=222440 RepID=A0A5J4WDT1_9EUKA|nr:MAG: hypothetical protein EZS28_011425 [Streblomastix strix]
MVPLELRDTGYKIIAKICSRIDAGILTKVFYLSRGQFFSLDFEPIFLFKSSIQFDETNISYQIDMNKYWAHFGPTHRRLAQGMRPRTMHNMNETNVNYEIRQKTAKCIGSKRRVPMQKETLSGHISLAATISPGIQPPPPLFILGSLKYVPEKMSNISLIEETQFLAFYSGFMNQILFRH